MKQMHDKEFAAILGMLATDRYRLFIERVTDWQEIWSLRNNDGWSLMSNEDQVELVPVCPHERFALACAEASDGEYAAAISLTDWIGKWIPGMSKDGRLIAVFPVPSGNGIVVTPVQMQTDLLTACEKYE